jgi:hypothetical protein
VDGTLFGGMTEEPGYRKTAAQDLVRGATQGAMGSPLFGEIRPNRREAMRYRGYKPT